eukprot:TRINITY_DN7932_c0_g1_i3.p1 TRINITY_DN7932_c0_g1~~TRINITY_DN7932_c0_g1_i3.p1  ORF type:complete len:149 (+),score=22.93 TRINITY_DN7932_c0_g1_i3:216-662(+)
MRETRIGLGRKYDNSQNQGNLLLNSADSSHLKESPNHKTAPVTQWIHTLANSKEMLKEMLKPLSTSTRNLEKDVTSLATTVGKLKQKYAQCKADLKESKQNCAHLAKVNSTLSTELAQAKSLSLTLSQLKDEATTYRDTTISKIYFYL